MLLDTFSFHSYCLAIAETKIDETFTTSQFLIDGFSKPIRFDRNQHGGGLLIYVRGYSLQRVIFLQDTK